MQNEIFVDNFPNVVDLDKSRISTVKNFKQTFQISKINDENIFTLQK